MRIQNITGFLLMTFNIHLIFILLRSNESYKSMTNYMNGSCYIISSRRQLRYFRNLGGFEKKKFVPTVMLKLEKMGWNRRWLINFDSSTLIRVVETCMEFYGCVPTFCKILRWLERRINIVLLDSFSIRHVLKV